jgi:hypothetical protein
MYFDTVFGFSKTGSAVMCQVKANCKRINEIVGAQVPEYRFKACLHIHCRTMSPKGQHHALKFFENLGEANGLALVFAKWCIQRLLLVKNVSFFSWAMTIKIMNLKVVNFLTYLSKSDF